MPDDHDSDVFDDNGPTIVDCDVLEAAKENIQPIAAGRRVTALSAILSTPHALRESRLSATRNRLRINVEIALEDEDDDPLEAYCRFIYWVVENYPQGHSAESGLLELLEEATRVLKDDRDGEWRGDIRYLKLWVLYASYVEKPAIIYKFCLVNDIGTNYALLYEEFAVALERAGRKSEADEIYLLGIARKASPPEKLELKYREFQKRMMSQITAPTVSEPERESEARHNNDVATQPKRRAALGDTSRPRPSPDPQETPDVFTLPSAVPPPSRNARLQVFIDPSGSGAAKTGDAPWSDLGTRKSRIKENLAEVSKAAGTTLRQAGQARREVATRAPKMTIYRDPEGSGERLESEIGPTQSGSQPEAQNNDIDDDEVDATGSSDPTPAPIADNSPEPPETNPSSTLPLTTSRRGMTTRSAAKLARSQGLNTDLLDTPTIIRATRSSGKKPSPKLQTARKSKSAAGTSKISVTQDEDSELNEAVSTDPPTILPKGKGKGKMTVFCDMPESNSPAQTAVSSPTILRGRGGSTSSTIYRDEPADPPSTVTNGSHAVPPKTPLPSKFIIPRDEEVGPLAVATKSKGKGLAPKLMVYRDEETQDTENIRNMPPPAVVPRKVSSSSTAKMVVFRDEAPASVRKAAAPAAKIAVYRDEPEATEIPSTPRFTPYRDEASTARTPALMSVMKDKSTSLGGVKGVKMSSEAEALRKDPLKNYAEGDKITDMD